MPKTLSQEALRAFLDETDDDFGLKLKLNNKTVAVKSQLSAILAFTMLLVSSMHPLHQHNIGLIFKDLK